MVASSEATAATVSMEWSADLPFSAATVMPAASSAASRASRPATESLERPAALVAVPPLRDFHRAAPRPTPVNTSAERWTSLKNLGIHGKYNTENSEKLLRNI